MAWLLVVMSCRELKYRSTSYYRLPINGVLKQGRHPFPVVLQSYQLDAGFNEKGRKVSMEAEAAQAVCRRRIYM